MTSFAPAAILGKRYFSEDTLDRILRSQSYFETLGVSTPQLSQSPDTKLMKSNYQKLVKLVHPDVCSDPRARDAFAKVQEAHEVLKDSVSARRHAAFLSQQSQRYSSGMAAARAMGRTGASAGASAAQPTAGNLFRWLDEKFVLLKGGHMLAAITAALALQFVISTIVASSETSAPVESHAKGALQALAKGALNMPARTVPTNGAAANSSASAAAPSTPTPQQSSWAPPFSSNEGQVLVGHSREEVMRSLDLRREAALMRRRQVLENLNTSGGTYVEPGSVGGGSSSGSISKGNGNNKKASSVAATKQKVGKKPLGSNDGKKNTGADDGADTKLTK